MASDKFRHQLRQEANQWQAEGLIAPPQYQQLSERYQFHTLDTAARNRFILILIGLGSILLGLEVITFVAANWQAWSRESRVFLLLSLFIGVNFAGFSLWRRQVVLPHGVDQWQQRLGQGLLLLGALILGANMALMAQMFHISGSPYRLYLAWGLGVLAIAYSLRLTSLGVLAILLVQLGYWQGEVALFSSELSWSQLVVQQMPLLAGLVFVPLAYWCRSRVLFVLAAIAVVSSLENSLSADNSTGWVAAIAYTLPPALLWGYDDSLLRFILRRQPQMPEISRSFQFLARSLAVVFLGSLFYWLSFHWAWDRSSAQPSLDRPLLSWTPLLSIAILCTLAVLEWLSLLRSARIRPGRRGLGLTTIMIAGFIAIAALVPFWHLEISSISVLATFIFNVLLFLLASGLIRESLVQGQRRTFWFGIALLTLQIISRLLEYDTGLLLKSFIFILCGIGVIAAGLWFERYVRILGTDLPTTPTLPEEESP